MGAHQHHPAGGPRIDAVTIMVGHDQAGCGGTHRFFHEAVEWPARLHQARPLILEYVPDRPVLELRVAGSPGVGDALVFQPDVQFDQALHPWLRAEQQIAQVADLVLDLSLLPSRGRRAGDWLDQMVRAHLQEAAIILARLANEDRLDRRLHVVVDAAPADAAIEQERLVVAVEHQFLSLAEVRAHERHPAVRQLHVRRLDGQWQALERDRFVAPVELVRLAGGETQRHECLHRNPCPFVAPRFGETVHTVMGTVVAAAAQLLEQPLRRSPLPTRQSGFFLQDLGQNLDPFAQFWRRLDAALIPELSRLAADHLAHRRARH